LVGDSAVTVRENGIRVVVDGASKIFYSPYHNFGLAIWGNGTVGDVAFDQWTADFIAKQLRPDDNLERIGNRYAEQLAAELAKTGKSWNDLRCGAHLTGYFNDLPRLWHIHTGAEDEPQYPPRLHRDFPDNARMEDGSPIPADMLPWILAERVGGGHLRNGYHKFFGPLFDSTLEYRGNIEHVLGIQFPPDSLKDCSASTSSW
jgi:hypothetical protein